MIESNRQYIHLNGEQFINHGLESSNKIYQQNSDGCSNTPEAITHQICETLKGSSIECLQEQLKRMQKTFSCLMEEKKMLQKRGEELTAINKSLHESVRHILQYTQSLKTSPSELTQLTQYIQKSNMLSQLLNYKTAIEQSIQNSNLAERSPQMLERKNQYINRKEQHRTLRIYNNPQKYAVESSENILPLEHICASLELSKELSCSEDNDSQNQDDMYSVDESSLDTNESSPSTFNTTASGTNKLTDPSSSLTNKLTVILNVQCYLDISSNKNEHKWDNFMVLITDSVTECVKQFSKKHNLSAKQEKALKLYLEEIEEASETYPVNIKIALTQLAVHS